MIDVDSTNVARLRVAGSDPRRWPFPTSPLETAAILGRIYGNPDGYANKTYGEIEASEQTFLAKKSVEFISQHVETEMGVVHRALETFPSYSRTIIDLGCRDGRLFSEMMKPGENRCNTFYNYFGIEINEHSYEFLRKRLAYDPSAHAILGDVTKLDRVLSQIDKPKFDGDPVISSPIGCILQNTLGTICGDGNWEDAISQLKLFLDNYSNSEIILSLYKSIKSDCTTNQVRKMLPIFEKDANLDSKLTRKATQNALALLGNGWLLPSYLYTKDQNGWPPDSDKLTESVLYVPSTGYTSRQWSEPDIHVILNKLQVKTLERHESDEFVVLRLARYK